MKNVDHYEKINNNHRVSKKNPTQFPVENRYILGYHYKISMTGKKVAILGTSLKIS